MRRVSPTSRNRDDESVRSVAHPEASPEDWRSRRLPRGHVGGAWRKGHPVRSLYHFRLLIALVDDVGADADLLY